MYETLQLWEDDWHRLKNICVASSFCWVRGMEARRRELPPSTKAHHAHFLQTRTRLLKVTERSFDHTPLRFQPRIKVMFSYLQHWGRCLHVAQVATQTGVQMALDRGPQPPGHGPVLVWAC